MGHSSFYSHCHSHHWQPQEIISKSYTDVRLTHAHSYSAQTGIPDSHLVPSAFKDSMTHRHCKSHYVSHFTAFFIVAGAQRSVVKSNKNFKDDMSQIARNCSLSCESKYRSSDRHTSHTTPRSAQVAEIAHAILTPIAPIVNDPSAGSPTETLLRLLLPLNDQVCPVSAKNAFRHPRPPEASLSHSIGSSDGRCVQRAGT